MSGENLKKGDIVSRTKLDGTQLFYIYLGLDSDNGARVWVVPLFQYLNSIYGFGASTVILPMITEFNLLSKVDKEPNLTPEVDHYRQEVRDESML